MQPYQIVNVAFMLLGAAMIAGVLNDTLTFPSDRPNWRRIWKACCVVTFGTTLLCSGAIALWMP